MNVKKKKKNFFTVDSAKLVDGVVVVRLQLEVTCVKSEVIETLATSADLNPDQINLFLLILDLSNLLGSIFETETTYRVFFFHKV